MTAPLVVLATWMTNRQSYPEKIIIIVSLSCSLLMVLFCAMQDRIANYKMTLLDGAFGFIMASSLAFFTVHGKNNLSKVCLLLCLTRPIPKFKYMSSFLFVLQCVS